jgi:hypothetical protein
MRKSSNEAIFDGILGQVGQQNERQSWLVSMNLETSVPFLGRVEGLEIELIIDHDFMKKYL